MSSRLRHFALRTSNKFQLFRPHPVHSLRPTHVSFRAFGHSRFCRNDKYVPSSIPTQRRPPVPIMMAPEEIPPKIPRKSTVRPLFRFIPWKSIIVIGVGIYIFSITERTVKDSIKAIVGQFTVPDDTWIYLNLNDLHVTDSPHSERALQLVPFVSSSGKRRMTVLEMVDALSTAASDPRVKGLVLSFNESIIEHRAVLTGEIIESHLGMGALNELRSALMLFRHQKRKQRETALVEIQHGLFSTVEPSVVGAPSPKDSQVVKNETPTPYSDISDQVIVAISDNYCILYSLCAADSSHWLRLLTGISCTSKIYTAHWKCPANRNVNAATGISIRKSSNVSSLERCLKNMELISRWRHEENIKVPWRRSLDPRGINQPERTLRTFL
jgi:hypothetical protein